MDQKCCHPCAQPKGQGNDIGGKAAAVVGHCILYFQLRRNRMRQTRCTALDGGRHSWKFFEHQIQADRQVLSPLGHSLNAFVELLKILG